MRKERWGPRTLDLDLIQYGDPVFDTDVRLSTEALTLPHPRAHERAFVLVPWADADPEAALRVDGQVRRVAELVAEVGSAGVRPRARTSTSWRTGGEPATGCAPAWPCSCSSSSASCRGCSGSSSPARARSCRVPRGWPPCSSWAWRRSSRGWAWPVRSYLAGRSTRRLDPLRAARVVVLAQAATLTGAAAAGWYAGQLAVVAGDLSLVANQDRLWRLALLVGAGLVLSLPSGLVAQSLVPRRPAVRRRLTRASRSSGAPATCRRRRRRRTSSPGSPPCRTISVARQHLGEHLRRC